MRIRDVIKLVAGSCAIYFVVAACSAYAEEDAKRGENADVDASSRPASPVPNALAEGHKSGTRLKLRFWEGSDGARQFINFFDSELKTQCNVGGAKTVDGKVRCLPPLSGTLVFGDAACKTRIGYVVSKTTDPQPRIGGVIDTTNGVTDYFELGALANPPASMFTGGDHATGGGPGEGCSPKTFDAASSSYYAIGAPLAPTAFVEMTIKNE